MLILSTLNRELRRVICRMRTSSVEALILEPGNPTAYNTYSFLLEKVDDESQDMRK